ncbi:polysaccharide biosynthesis/export family protein [Ensifer sp. LCM 4579]|uniref:polysaccharide biosynthesis/export family protein n=1 Tax=Ensifer sp. LCM 4579 TaxID=1848292 RepID=UPI001FCDC16F|nr:polysaccharide biosynthesis/export family protein [Ensifer sp. LCM 4579]
MTDDRLAPHDTVEISVAGWHALLGGVAEAALLNDTFTIGAGGTVELPVIGRLPAAGLSESELAKLITDRLQARSGSDQRPVTTVQRRRPAPEGPSSRATSAEAPPPAAQTGVAGPAATERLGSERSRVDALLGDLAAARMELKEARGEARAARDAARSAAIRHDRRLAAERRRVAVLTQELTAARADLEAANARLQQEVNAARNWDAAIAMVNEARELVVRERAKGAEAEEKFLAARKEVDAMRRAADYDGVQARKADAIAAEQGRALENARQRAEGLALNLAVLQRDFERLGAKMAGAIRSKAAALRARNAAEASLADVRQTLEAVRRKFAANASTLAVVRRSALEARAEFRAAKQAALQADRLAKVAASRADEALDAERKKARSLARDLEIAREERDAARKELAGSSAAPGESLGDDDESNDRRLAVERRGGKLSKGEAQRPKATAGRRQNVGVGDHPSEHAKAVARKRVRSAREGGSPEIREAELGKSTPRARSVTIVLPDALLPRRSLTR